MTVPELVQKSSKIYCDTFCKFVASISYFPSFVMIFVISNKKTAAAKQPQAVDLFTIIFELTRSKHPTLPMNAVESVTD